MAMTFASRLITIGGFTTNWRIMYFSRLVNTINPLTKQSKIPTYVTMTTQNTTKRQPSHSPGSQQHVSKWKSQQNYNKLNAKYEITAAGHWHSQALLVLTCQFDLTSVWAKMQYTVLMSDHVRTKLILCWHVWTICTNVAKKFLLGYLTVSGSWSR